MCILAESSHMQKLLQDPDTEEISLAWDLSPIKYVKAAIDNVEDCLAKNFNGRKLPKKCAKFPFATNHRPEIDLSHEELDDKLCNCYQSQMGVLHWMAELGRVDTMTEVSELAS